MRFSNFVNDPRMQSLLIFNPANPNTRYNNALLIDSLIDYLDAPENSDIKTLFLSMDLSIEKNKDDVLQQMRSITTLPIPPEIFQILQIILSGGGRDQYLIQKGSKYSQEELDRIVELVNTNFALDKNSTITPTSLTSAAKGPLLYPCSGSDVTYPLLLCPEVNEFYLLDQHPLFEPGSSEFHRAFHEIMTEHSSGKKFKIDEALGAFGGYDCTCPQRQFEYLRTNELGLILLLRLRQLCGMTIHHLEIVTPGVYQILGTIDGQEKTIYYVQHNLGEESAAYQWLQQRVQEQPFETVFLKAFSASINESAISQEFFHQFQQLLPLTNRSNMTVISDTSSGYPRGHVPDVLDPQKASLYIQTVPFEFGYDAHKMIVARGDILTANYASIEQQERRLKSKLLAEQSEWQELTRKKEKELTHFHQLNLTEKIAELIAKDYMRQDETSVTFILDDSIFLEERLKPCIHDLLLALRNNHNITSIKIELRQPNSGFSHIKELLKPIIDALPAMPSVQSLTISAPEGKELAFRSDEAKIIAKELITSGKNLVSIDVQVNNGGALAFASTFTALRNNHSLCSGHIRPITAWRPQTEEQVNACLSSFTQSAGMFL